MQSHTNDRVLSRTNQELEWVVILALPIRFLRHFEQCYHARVQSSSALPDLLRIQAFSYGNAHCLKKYSKAKEAVKSTSTAIPAPKQNEVNIQQLLAHGIVVQSGQDRYAYTIKGEAWEDAGKPPLDTFNFTQPPAPPPEETDLTFVIPYLDIGAGYVTFGRVPQHMRQIDGKPIRDLLVTAGIIDDKLFLTDKGKAWCAHSEHTPK